MTPGAKTSAPAAGWRPAPPAPRPAWVDEALGSPTGEGVRVGVIDSGWDRTLGDPRVVPGVGLVDPADELALGRDDDDHDRNGHGTACADLILRIAPQAEIVPIRVFGHELETSPSVLQAGLRWAVEQELDVVNVSLGTLLEETLRPLYAICEAARRQGTLIVAAGHNASDWSYPAIFENVIGVAAGRFDSVFDYQYRPDDAMECVAWGVEARVLDLGGGRVTRSGTSFAAPNIAGIVTLIRHRHPRATIEEVREMLAKFALGEPAPASAEDQMR